MTKYIMKHLINKTIILIPLLLCAVNVSIAHIYEPMSFSSNRNSVYNKERMKKYEEAFIEYHAICLSPKHDEFSKRDSYFACGHFFAHGHGVSVNVDSALYYLNIAADIEAKQSLNTYNAHRLLAMIYYLPEYGRVNLPKSLYYLKKAAELGDVKSNLELGEIYLSGQSHYLADTLISVVRKNLNYRGDSILERSNSVHITPTDIMLHYPSENIDSIKGYYYSKRGIDVNRHLVGSNYLLTELDFAKSYMYGTYSEKDYDAVYQYLSRYLDDDDFICPEVVDPEYAEAYWLLQTCFRFGLGTRVNIKKADYYLRKAANCGSINAKEALK